MGARVVEYAKVGLLNEAQNIEKDILCCYVTTRPDELDSVRVKQVSEVVP
jgi:hypothetical protein